MSLIMMAARQSHSEPPPPTWEIGNFIEGGYYVGDIVVGGVTYRVVAAPKSTQVTRMWKGSDTTDVGAQSRNDGWTNSNNLNTAAYPAINYCRTLNVNGFTDWYLPAADELELFRRNGNPQAGGSNATGSRTAPAGGGNMGDNANSSPPGASYTVSNPGQSVAAVFQTGGSQSFDGVSPQQYWSSTTSSFSGNLFPALYQSVGSGGNQVSSAKNVLFQVRAVRRVVKV